jgi:tetratricopeptide (TPR) repeat protein
MSEQRQEPGEAPGAAEQVDQESHYLSGTHLEARDITATNVVSGWQHIGEQHIHLPVQKYASPLHRPRRAEHFQDRVTERAWLLSNLFPGRIVTICGPGGMGKTALVAEVIWTLAPGDTPPETFPHGIVFHTFYGQPEAAVALEQIARTFGEDPLPNPRQAAQRALSGKHVLLVLDGAEEAENLEQVLSVCASCAVLVTSQRRSDAADPALLLDLQLLPSDAAVAVVQAWQAQCQTDIPVIKRIVHLVGGLPLALRLVGSYLALHQDKADDYLAWLEEDLFEALNQGSTTSKSVPVLLERSVARLSPDAQSVISVIGMLALAPFERELVAGILELAPRAASRALGMLVDYGLLVRVKTAYEVSHPLIHAYARQVLLARQEETQQRVLVERFFTVLAEHFPEVTQMNWAKSEQLVPHIQACFALLEQKGVILGEAALLFNRAGEYLLARAQYEQAAVFFERAHAIIEQVLGPEHPATAAILANMAWLYRVQGKYEQAAPFYQRALAIYEQAFGPRHSNTATMLNNLAQLYRTWGKYEQAASLFEQALAIDEQVLGPEHPTTATILDNLASLYYQQGKYEQAEELYQRAIHVKEQALGLEHPDTATTLNNLASLYHEQGKYEQAEELYQRALAIFQRMIGLEHPDTSRILNNLAQLYHAQGKYEQAAPLYQRVLVIQERLLGPEHPDTAVILDNLAQLHLAQREYKQAEEFYQRALTIRIRKLGPDHPDTATTSNNLALLYHEQGKYEQAEEFYQRALEIYEKVLSPMHHVKAGVLHNLASLYKDQKKYVESEPLCRQALAILEQQLGPTHPRTEIVRRNYAQILLRLSPDNEKK